MVLWLSLPLGCLAQGKENVIDFGLPGPSPVLSLKGPSYDLGEEFIRKALLNHMSVIQVQLSFLAFPL